MSDNYKDEIKLCSNIELKLYNFDKDDYAELVCNIELAFKRGPGYALSKMLEVEYDYKGNERSRKLSELGNKLRLFTSSDDLIAKEIADDIDDFLDRSLEKKSNLRDALVNIRLGVLNGVGRMFNKVLTEHPDYEKITRGTKADVNKLAAICYRKWNM
jgi:hypothetical protein